MRRLMAAVGGAVLAVTLVTGGAASASTATRVPRACARALDRAEVVMDYAVQGFTLTSQMFEAVSDLDPATLSDLGDELNALIPEVTAARAAYDKSARACRAA